MALSSARALEALVSNFFAVYPQEAAQQLERLHTAEVIRLVHKMPHAHAVTVFENLTPPSTPCTRCRCSPVS
jgi:hypothetical protein